MAHLTPSFGLLLALGSLLSGLAGCATASEHRDEPVGRVIDLRLLASFPLHAEAPATTRATWSADGRALIWQDGVQHFLWDVDAAPDQAVRVDLPPFLGPGFAGKQFLSRDEQGLSLYDADARRIAQRLVDLPRPRSGGALLPAPDGQSVFVHPALSALSRDFRGIVRLDGTRTGRRVEVFPHANWVEGAWHPVTGELLCAEVSGVHGESGSIARFDAAGALLKRTSARDTGPPGAISLSPDGRTLVHSVWEPTMTESPPVCVLDATTLVRLHERSDVAAVVAAVAGDLVHLDADTLLVASGLGHEKLALWNAHTLATLRELDAPSCGRLSASPDRRLLAALDALSLPGQDEHRPSLRVYEVVRRKP